MSDGEPHPSAKNPVLIYALEQELGLSLDSKNISMTSSRLASLGVCFCNPAPAGEIIVWDWITGEVLMVRYSSLFRCPLIKIVFQHLRNPTYHSIKFVDDFWLMILRGGVPTRLTFLDTKEARTNGVELVQTTFHFDYTPGKVKDDFSLTLQGGHEPSCADDLFTPFHPDPSQRVLAVDRMLRCADVLVIKAETVLRLAQERKGEDLPWGEWEDYVTWVQPVCRASAVWISGSRLRCVYPMIYVGAEEEDSEGNNRNSDDEFPFIEEYDFSVRASSSHMGTLMNPNATQELSREISCILGGYGCHDSVVIVVVITLHSSNPT